MVGGTAYFMIWILGAAMCHLRDSLSLITITAQPDCRVNNSLGSRPSGVGEDESIEQQRGIDNASQNILRAGQQADRRTRVGNQQLAKKHKLQSLGDTYICRYDCA